MLQQRLFDRDASRKAAGNASLCSRHQCCVVSGYSPGRALRRIYGLLADSLDNLGDALTYGLSLYAVSRSAGTKARVALFKGGLIVLAASVVATQVLYKLFAPRTPVFEIMGAFSLIGLAANSVCLYLLWRHRHEDVNMSSVWECSRNDIAANLSVFVAAGAVWLTGSGWPDVLVATGLLLLLMRSAIRIIASARAVLHRESQASRV